MRTCHLTIVLFTFACLGASTAWGSVESADKLRPSPVASVLPTVAQRNQLGMLDARALDLFSEAKLIAFFDDKENEPPPPPPPARSDKCPPGHGGDDDHGNDGHGGTGGNDGHDCRIDK